MRDLRQKTEFFLRKQNEVLLSRLNRPPETWTKDDIHDIRVATRRLKSLIWIMNPKLKPNTRKSVKKLKASLSKLSRDVGEIRHWQIVEDYASEAHLPTIEITQLEKDAHQRVKQKWSKERRHGLLRRLEKGTLLIHLPSGKKIEVCAMSRLQSIEREREKWRKNPPQQKKDWHHLRLFVKRWRYFLEATNFARKSSEIKKLERLQDTLGDLHDLEICRKELGPDFPAVKTEELMVKANGLLNVTL